MTKQSKFHIVARILELCIGIYFVVGALPKGLDIDKFAVQIAAYHVINTPNMLLLTALFTLFVEVGLGIAMIAGLRLKGLTILIMQAMLVFFAVLIIYAWRVYGLEDCGCFPFIKMSPQMSLIKNAVLISSGLFILWVTFRVPVTRANTEEANKRSRGVGAALLIPCLKILVAVVLASAATAYAYQDIDWQSFVIDDTEENNISYAQFELFLPEGYFNLGEGIYLVAVMSMSCDECMANVPDLNALWGMAGVPPIVALCYEDFPGDMEIFRGNTQPVFPMHSLENRAMLYYSLIGDDSFRLSLIQDGKLKDFWDGHVPEYQEIMEAIEALNNDESQ